jgi:hypothetical protein
LSPETSAEDSDIMIPHGKSHCYDPAIFQLPYTEESVLSLTMLIIPNDDAILVKERILSIIE